MNILIMEVKIRVAYVHSLKEKRMILRSIRDRLKNNFNISISETGDNDDHKNIVLGIASVSNEKRVLENTSEKIIDFIEENCDGEIIEIFNEIEKY
ncbi:DUF503 domain-containing protein [uncultured Clostridium sp.]|uniref:DUF503 domain-containing protein n=1 Tax=uncultured Clostridium sp. TaxID=59620 RepID=UPI002636C629|nr:DUF503 domain-containing protein [uncultured Clostridium sp.]